MVAKHTIKIDDKYYKAGDIIPDEKVKAVTTTVVEPPVSDGDTAEQPKQRKQYTRKK